MTRNIHLLGIGGVGMAGVAFLLKTCGCKVSGCDLSATARTRWLEANGIPVALGNDVGCPWITQYDFWRELVSFRKYTGVSNAFAIHTLKNMM